MVMGLAVLVPSCAMMAVAADEAEGRPNVLVVMTDDQDTRSTGVMPKVRALARTGVRFTNFYATFPLCCPSRATFLTGQYAHNHKVMSNRPPRGGYASFDDRRTLPIVLDRAGYRTGYVGKYLNGYDSGHVPPGWDVWRGLLGASAYRMEGPYELSYDGIVRTEREYQTDLLAREGEAFIADAAPRRQPFFLAFMPVAPHLGGNSSPPAAPARYKGAFATARVPKGPSYNERHVGDKPPSLREPPLTAKDHRWIRNRYRARLRSLLPVNDAIRRLLGELRASGELQNTLVVFTSDNGFLLGQHRRVHKKVLYEESARVPFVIRGPGVPSGVARPQLAGNVDLAPTIYDATGTRSLRKMDGRSLLPTARWGRRAHRSLLLENETSVGIRSGKWMYAEHRDGRELYDLRSDPLQMRSRHDAARYRPVMRRLAEKIAALRR